MLHLLDVLIRFKCTLFPDAFAQSTLLISCKISLRENYRPQQKRSWMQARSCARFSLILHAELNMFNLEYSSLIQS
jgi:hypothetical protein